MYSSTRDKVTPPPAQAGQVILEFVLVMLIIFSMLFFLVQVTLFLSFGNFVQYATFMSARAYQSAWPTKKLQREHAQNVLARTVKKSGGSLDRMSFAAVGIDGNGGGNGSSDLKGASIGEGEGFTGCPVDTDSGCDEALSWAEGVRYSFKGRVFTSPVAPGRVSDPAATDVILTSESWLGREPTYEECKKGMISGAIFDNGC